MANEGKKQEKWSVLESTYEWIGQYILYLLKETTDCPLSFLNEREKFCIRLQLQDSPYIHRR